jgi:hypothetical protein
MQGNLSPNRTEMNTPTPETDAFARPPIPRTMGAQEYSDQLLAIARNLERQRNAAIDDLRSLADAISQFGGGASMLHPRITRSITAARKTLAIYDHPATK